VIAQLNEGHQIQGEVPVTCGLFVRMAMKALDDQDVACLATMALPVLRRVPLITWPGKDLAGDETSKSHHQYKARIRDE